MRAGHIANDIKAIAILIDVFSIGGTGSLRELPEEREVEEFTDLPRSGWLIDVQEEKITEIRIGDRGYLGDALIAEGLSTLSPKTKASEPAIEKARLIVAHLATDRLYRGMELRGPEKGMGSGKSLKDRGTGLGLFGKKGLEHRALELVPRIDR